MTDVITSKKKRAKFTLQEILTSLNQHSAEVDPGLKQVVRKYYEETELFLDRVDTELQQKIMPLHDEITALNEKLATPFYAEKDKKIVIGGVDCITKIRDKKTIAKHYQLLYEQKSELLQRIKSLKNTYIKQQDLIMQELQGIRKIKQRLQKQKLEYIAVLPTRVLTSLTEEASSLYTFRDIGKNGKIRIKRIGFNKRLDWEIYDENDKLVPNVNPFTVCPVKIKNINDYKSELKTQKSEDSIFPRKFWDWSLHFGKGFGILVASGILGFFLYDWYAFLLAWIGISGTWILISTAYMLWRYYAGFPAKITLPPAPETTQKRLREFKKHGFKIYPIVEENAYSISPLKNYQSNPAQACPILLADKGDYSIIVNQYGEFAYEKAMIEKIQKMFDPENRINPN